MKKKQKDQLEQLAGDLESIFQQSMACGKLSVALKAKEILARLRGIFPCSSKSAIKPLTQWSDEEIYHFLSQIKNDNL